MCGRYVFKVRLQVLHRLFPELAGLPFPTLRERWNAAPTQELPIIRATPGNQPLALELVEAKWGLVPSWAETPKPGPINARSETVASNALFRNAFKSRRCVVPASGFYEWQERMLAPKLPLYITRADDEPALMAGLWEKRGELETFTIITVPSQGAMKEIHERTPAILEPGSEVRVWLDPSTLLEQARAAIHPAHDGILQWHPVSNRVNSPKNDGPELVEPVSEQ